MPVPVRPALSRRERKPDGSPRMAVQRVARLRRWAGFAHACMTAVLSVQEKCA